MVEEFGLVEIDGEFQPISLTKTTQLNLVFTNLDLPTVRPYVIKFAGRDIEQGKADLDLQYNINEHELRAFNQVLLRNIQLGERVDSLDALDIPLDFAIALLKDRDGNIDLDIPITGDLANPEFSIGPIILQAITNVLGNIVSAPLRFLASLIGGEAVEFEAVRFHAGRRSLTPPEHEKLQQLGEMFEQREALILNVPAPYNLNADKQALQKESFEQRLEVVLAGAAAEKHTNKCITTLETLYQEAALQLEMAELQQAFMKENQEASATQAAVDSQAYRDALKKRLIAAENISENHLNTLAMNRQWTIIDYLSEHTHMEADRLNKQFPAETDAEAGWVEVEFDIGMR